MTNYFYTSQPGDTLSKITLRYYGNAMLWPELYKWNDSVVGSNPDVLKVYTELWMPPELNDRLLTKSQLYIVPTSQAQRKPQKPQKKMTANKIFVIAGIGLAAMAFLI